MISAYENEFAEHLAVDWRKKHKSTIMSVRVETNSYELLIAKDLEDSSPLWKVHQSLEVMTSDEVDHRSDS